MKPNSSKATSHLSILSEVERTHVSYVQAIHRFRDDNLDTAFREMLGIQGNLINGPFLEVQPSYALQAESREAFDSFVGTSVDEGTLKSISPHPRVYAHQASALKLVASQENCVVASGTGSGKTEAFLFPILLHLYKEALAGTLVNPGVRALILYPMNALSNDQLDRLTEIAGSLATNGSDFRFTYGQYTGETPTDENDVSRDGQTKVQNRRSGELVTRKEMQAKPPHILLTNYSMLEYLLLRPDDSPLFDNGNAANWRFIVVDEAHQYNGTKGTEISFLLRRLKQRLREGGRSAPFTAIATSATIGGNADDRQSIARFASDLFGEPFEQNNILFGDRVEIPQHHDIPDPSTLEDVERKNSAQKLRDPNFRAFLEATMKTPRTVTELSELLNVSIGDVERSAAEVASLLDPTTGRALTNVRYHIYLRTLPGLYLRLYPTPQIALNQRDDEGAWFHVGLCRRCGEHYILGECADGKYAEVSEAESRRTRYWRPSYSADDEGDAWSLNVKTGELVLGVRPETESSAEWHLLQAAPQTEKGDDEWAAPPCITCGYKSRNPIRNPRLETMEPQALLALALHNSLPEERSRVLAFADGRQDAAKFAVEAQDFADDVVMRRAVRSIIEDEGDESDITFEDLAHKLAGALGRLRVLEFRGQKGRLAAYRFLLREIINTTDAGSLVNNGVLVPYVRIPEPIRVPMGWNSTFDEHTSRQLIEHLLESMIEDGAISLQRLDVNVAFNELETAVRQTNIVKGEVEGRRGIKSWDALKGRRAGLVRSRIAPNVSDEDITNLLLEGLRFLCELNDEYEQSVLISAGEGYQLDIATVAFYGGQKRSACSLCGLVRRPGLATACPRNRCRGTLQPHEVQPDEDNPFHRMYGADVGHSYFRIEEHTAQLSRTLARTYQEQFKNGRISALSSSTTFELGVDLGTLDVVFLRNVPPESFNYTQRVGRVGRRRGFPGLVIVFARQRSHDFYHFQDPRRMIVGRTRPPSIALSNDLVFSRHVVAAVFSKFFKKNPASIDSAGILMEFGHSGVVDAVADFCDAECEKLEKHLAETFQDVPALIPLISSGQWRTWVHGRDSRLDRAYEEYLADMSTLEGIETRARGESDYKRAAWAKERVETIRAEHALSFLSQRVVLPKYGFPVDVVSLDTQPSRRGQEESPVGLSRDLSIAIREYSPFSEVVAAKKGWKSVAVKRVPGREWDRRRYKACVLHGVYAEAVVGAPLDPRGCCKRMVRGEYIVPHFGFLTYPNSGRRPSGVTQRPPQTQPFFVEETTGGEWKSVAGGTLEVMTASPGDLVVIADPGGGIALCTECGLRVVEKDASKPHFPASTPRGHAREKCVGKIVKNQLAHRFKTTVLRLRFPSINLPYDPRECAALFVGIGTALTEAAAELLQVPSNELDFTMTGDTEGAGQTQHLILFDKAPGGAGLVEQLSDVRLLFEAFAIARERTSGTCGCGPAGSCYSCLRTYRNQEMHPTLRRGDVYAALDEIASTIGGNSSGSVTKFGA